MFPMTIYCWDPGEDWNFRLAPGGSHRADAQRFKSWGGDRPRQCLTIGTMVEGKGWWYVDVRGCSWRLMNAFAIVDPMKRGKNMEKYGTIWINMDKYGKIWNNMENAWCSGSPLNMERFFFCVRTNYTEAEHVMIFWVRLFAPPLVQFLYLAGLRPLEQIGWTRFKEEYHG